MLGRDLQTELAGHDVTALSRADLDVTDAAAVARAVDGQDVVVNAAAYTRVDDAESDAARAEAVNATAAGALAAAVAQSGGRLLQISTDYVFDGAATEPYAENARTHPLSVYGQTKLRGERLATQENPERTWIVRTSWLYGAHGPNFVDTMLTLAATNDRLTAVGDQRGQPTWTIDLARQLLLLAESDAPAGIYHATNSGSATRYELARRVFSERGLDPERLSPASSADFPRPAPRPAYSVLGHDHWGAVGLAAMRPWQDALAEYLG
jgi:dTDP-4-dehydrorhamnose reductase